MSSLWTTTPMTVMMLTSIDTLLMLMSEHWNNIPHVPTCSKIERGIHVKVHRVAKVAIGCSRGRGDVDQIRWEQ